MGPRTLILWTTIAALSTAGAVYVGVEAQNRVVTAASLDEPVFAALVAGPETAAAISIEQGGDAFDVVRDGETWVVPDRWRHEADAAVVRALLSGLRDLRYAAPRTALEERFSRLAVDEPREGSDAVRIRIVDAAGSVIAEGIVGKRSEAISQSQRGTYLRPAGSEQAWLASGTVEIPTAVVDWLATDLPSVARDQVKLVTVTPAEGESFTVGRLAADEDLTLTLPVPEGRTTDPGRIRALAGVAAGLRFDDVRPADDVVWPDTWTTVEVTDFDDSTLTAELATIGEERWVRFDVDEAWVYRLPGFQLDRLDVAFEDLLQAPDAS